MTLLTSREIAQILHVHPETVRRAARRGALPSLQVGRAWRFDVEAVLRALAATPAEPRADRRRRVGGMERR
jgi:excisionase family DNA binding protein